MNSSRLPDSPMSYRSPATYRLGIEGKPEEREQPRVEEVRDMGDPTG